MSMFVRGGKKPGLMLVLPTVFLLALAFAFWRLHHYDRIHPRDWFRTQGPLFKAPTASNFRKTIVMGTLQREDYSWVERDLPDWERAIYVTDADPAQAKGILTVPRNKGNEANVYLWHIIQNYDDLADVMLFLHPHHNGWHVDNEEQSNPNSVQRLHLNTVLREGFVNLRCVQFPGCPQGMELNWNETGDVVLPETVDTKDVMPAAFDIMFPFGLDNANATFNYTTETPPVRPNIIAAPCCAQFAVTRSQVHQRPREDYERYHAWLMATELADYTSGRVMEYLWHIIFGRPAFFCPDMELCYAQLYGGYGHGG